MLDAGLKRWDESLEAIVRTTRGCLGGRGRGRLDRVGYRTRFFAASAVVSLL